MAMTGAGLASAVKAAISGIPEDSRDHDAVWNAVGDALVAYIKTNAQVVVTSVSGVTTGGGVSGPGTGTIT